MPVKSFKDGISVCRSVLTVETQARGNLHSVLSHRTKEEGTDKLARAEYAFAVFLALLCLTYCHFFLFFFVLAL